MSGEDHSDRPGLPFEEPESPAGRLGASCEDCIMSDWPARVVEKLQALRQADPKWQIFGAYQHQYRFGPTLSSKELAELEERYAIRLPEDYRAFLMQIGNGGCGPGYGLQRFGDERLLARWPRATHTGQVREVAKTPQCSVSVAVMVDSQGREVDRFELQFYNAIERLKADPDAIRRPFPFVQSAFRLEEESDDFAADEEGVFQGGAGDGILMLAHYGSGIFAVLVVTGEQAGTVWVNDRTNGVGIGHFADYRCCCPDVTLHGGLNPPTGPHSFAVWYEDWLDASLKLAARAD